VVFRKRRGGEAPPIRYLQGDRTRLADPHGIVLDPVRGLLFVSNFGSVLTTEREQAQGVGGAGDGKKYWPLDRTQAVPGSGRNVPASITVYRKGASGHTAPVQVITG